MHSETMKFSKFPSEIFALLLQEPEMAESGRYSVFVNGRCDIVCGSLDIVSGIAHRHPYAGIFNYRNIIAAVSESHALFPPKPKAFQNLGSAM